MVIVDKGMLPNISRPTHFLSIPILKNMLYTPPSSISGALPRWTYLEISNTTVNISESSTNNYPLKTSVFEKDLTNFRKQNID